MSRGKLILLEGLDRTGKTTQCEKLTNYLETELKIAKVKQLKFPNRESGIGKVINEYLTNKNSHLNDQSIHLLFSANRWESIEYIKETLNKGQYIIMDRYVYSGIAYSLAKEVENMDLNWCLTCDKGLIKPDLTIFLTNDNINDDRDGFGEERYEKKLFQEKVKLNFFKIFKTIDNYDTKTQNPNLKILNVTNKNIQQVTDLIINETKDIIINEQYQIDEFQYF